MATDGSEIGSGTLVCERCGKQVRSAQRLQAHLTTSPERGGCPGAAKKRGGIIIGTDRGEVEIGPKSPRDLYME